MKINFTKEQFANWRSYEQVRRAGHYNMYDPRARRMADLSLLEYAFVKKHYGALKKAVEAERHTSL